MKEGLYNWSLVLLITVILLFVSLWIVKNWTNSHTECSIYGTNCPPSCTQLTQGVDCP